MRDRSQSARVRQPAAARRRPLPVSSVVAVLAALAWLVAPVAVAVAGSPAGQAAAPPAVRAANAATIGGPQFALLGNGDDSFTHNYNVALALASLSPLGYPPQKDRKRV